MDFKRERTNIIIVFVVGVLLFSGTLIIFGRDIQARVAHIEVVRRDRAIRLQVIDSLAQLRAGAPQAEKLFPKLQNILPSRDELVSFTDIVESQAERYDITASFKFGEEQESGDGEPGQHTFVLNTAGFLRPFSQFMNSFESLNYIVSVDSIVLSRENNETPFRITAHGSVFSQ